MRNIERQQPDSGKKEKLKRGVKKLGLGALIVGAAVATGKLLETPKISESAKEPGLEGEEKSTEKRPTLEVDPAIVARRAQDKIAAEKRTEQQRIQRETELKEAATLDHEAKIKRWTDKIETPIDVFSDYANQFQEKRDYPIEKQKEVESILTTYIQEEIIDQIAVYLKLMEDAGQSDVRQETQKKLSKPIELLRRKGYELPSAAEFLRR